MDLTHPLTRPFSAETLTDAPRPYGRPDRERETTLTHPLTDLTHREPYARGGLYIETPGQSPQILTLETRPR